MPTPALFITVVISTILTAILSPLINWLIEPWIHNKSKRFLVLAAIAVVTIIAFTTIAIQIYSPEFVFKETTTIPTPTSSTPSWYLVNTSPQQTLWDIQMLSDTDGWAVGGWCCDPWISKILHWNGSAWKSQANPGQYQLFTIDLQDISNGWAGGQFGEILRLQDNQWQKISSPTNFDIIQISMVSNTIGWAIARKASTLSEDSQILKFSNNQWNVYTSEYLGLNGIDMVSKSDGWIVGGNGLILHFDGNNWSPTISPTTGYLYRIQMLSSTTGWAAGWDGILLMYADGIWQEFETEAKTRFYAIDFISADEGWLAGERIYHYKNGLLSQEHNPSTNTIFALDLLSSMQGWGVGFSDAPIIYYH